MHAGNTGRQGGENTAGVLGLGLKGGGCVTLNGSVTLELGDERVEAVGGSPEGGELHGPLEVPDRKQRTAHFDIGLLNSDAVGGPGDSRVRLANDAVLGRDGREHLVKVVDQILDVGEPADEREGHVAMRSSSRPGVEEHALRTGRSVSPPEGEYTR